MCVCGGEKHKLTQQLHKGVTKLKNYDGWAETLKNGNEIGCGEASTAASFGLGVASSCDCARCCDCDFCYDCDFGISIFRNLGCVVRPLSHGYKPFLPDNKKYYSVYYKQHPYTPKRPPHKISYTSLSHF